MIRLRPSGDAGSLPLTMLLVTVAVLSSALIVDTVVDQTDTTKLTTQRLSSLQAARAGLDVASAAIRSTAGFRTRLPCATTAQPMTGSVGAAGASPRFSVTIQYFTTDPIGRDDPWRAGNAIPCTAGAGVATTPAYAGLVSTGTDRPAGAITGPQARELRGTYTFATTNANVAGGLIHVFRGTSTETDLCLDAGSATPTPGTAVTTQACTVGKLSQTWGYLPNLTLALIPSQVATRPLGVCLQAGSGAVGNQVEVQPCAAVTAYTQQWSFNDAANFEGTGPNNKANGICFQNQNVGAVNSPVVLAAACGGGFNRSTTYSPDKSVGAGMAGAATTQLVNYDQFGRCLDVTMHVVTASDMVSWPCKQAPDPAEITWNQKWALPIVPNLAAGPNAVVGQVRTNGTYCLQSPGSTAYKQYVTIKPCVPLQANQQWTATQATEEYGTSYTIIDYQGNCLTPRDPLLPNPDLYQDVNQISKIYVASCDETALQKWNAPPNLIASQRLKDLAER